MQQIAAAVLVLALGASARPQFGFGHHSHSFPHWWDSPTSGGGAYPTASSEISALPTGFPAGSGSAPAGPIGTGTAPAGPIGTGSAPAGPIGTGSAPAGPIPTGAAPSGPIPTASAPVGPFSSEAAPPTYGGSSSEVPAVPVVTKAAAVGDSLSSGGGLPASSGSSALSAVKTIAAGESFDGGMVMYDRGVDCTGQEEGGDSDAVFELENGATLSNVIIGPNQIEGVHCNGACNLKNVWWSAVCEDAFSIKEQAASETTTITGGGAFGAEDKVIQHNGAGTVSVSGFTVDNFGKLYRSCGNCDEMYERHVIIDDVTATGGSEIAGINDNYGDTATLTNIKVSDVDDICVTYTGNDSGDEPEESGSGPSDACNYSTSDITEV